MRAKGRLASDVPGFNQSGQFGEPPDHGIRNHLLALKPLLPVLVREDAPHADSLRPGDIIAEAVADEDRILRRHAQRLQRCVKERRVGLSVAFRA